jgi:hypothetical protein
LKTKPYTSSRLTNVAVWNNIQNLSKTPRLLYIPKDASWLIEQRLTDERGNKHAVTACLSRPNGIEETENGPEKMFLTKRSGRQKFVDDL